MNPVWKLLEDLKTKKGISEIVINAPGRVFVERAGEFIGLNVPFDDSDIEDFVRDVAQNNNTYCDESTPILDGNLPDGSRINIIHSPFASKSTAITIRKYSKTNMTLDNHSQSFGIEPKWIPFFKSLIKAKMNVIVAGGTGVGKTTFMNMMLREVAPVERVITIEDTLELDIKNINCVRLEAGSKLSANNLDLSTRDLVKNSLRMRPDRIIIGEVRGAEVFDLLQAMNTGHEGSMASVHANNSLECLSRIETLFMMAGFDIPYHVVRRHISQAVDYVIQLGRGPGGKRVVKQVLEINNMEGNNILTSSILDNDDDGILVSTGVAPTNLNRLVDVGELPKDYFA